MPSITLKKYLTPISLPIVLLLASQQTLGAEAWFVQVGAFKNKRNAEKTVARFEQKTALAPLLSTKKKGLYTVVFGPYQTQRAAKKVLANVRPFSTAAFLLHEKTNIQSIKIVPQKQKGVPRKKITKQKNTLSFLQKTSMPAYPTFPNMSTRFYGFPYASRGLADGTWGQQTNLGNGDYMMPLFGNNDWIAYFDGAGKYGDDHAWFGSVGAGIRAAFNNHIWGAYFFTDDNASIRHKTFWFANPGVEYMTPALDLRFNGYIPLTSKTQSFGNFFASKLGLPGVHINDRTLYDPIYNVQDITGPGIDGEVGYTFKNYHNVRPFLGGYHFFSFPNSTHINGIEGGIQIPFGEHIQLRIHDAYDPVQKNTAMGTLRILMGGVRKNQFGNVRDRMLDPIERHLGAYQTGSGVPILQYNRFVRTDSLHTNIWFFSPGGSAFVGSASCTSENPCSLDQTAIDGINGIASAANFFFAPGTYDNPAIGNGFSLYNGQGFYGRTANWLHEATANDRALLNDSLILNGNNTVESLRVQGNTLTANTFFGIRAVSAATGYIHIMNSNVNVSGNNAADYIYGIDLTSSNTQNQLMGNRINLSVNTITGFGSVIGISLQSPSSLQGNTINIEHDSSSYPYLDGIHNASGSTTIRDTTINVSSITSAARIAGIINQDTLLIDNAAINVIGNDVTNGAWGILVYAPPNTNTTLSNSMIKVIDNHLSNSQDVVGIGSNSTTSTNNINYQNSSIITETTSPGKSVPVNNKTGTVITNNGGMTCIKIQDGVVTETSCP